MEQDKDYFGFYHRIQELVFDRLDESLKRTPRLTDIQVLHALRDTLETLKDEGWFAGWEHSDSHEPPPEPDIDDNEIDDDLLVESLRAAGIELDGPGPEKVTVLNELTPVLAENAFDRTWAIKSAPDKIDPSSYGPEITDELGEQLGFESARRWHEKDMLNRDFDPGIDDTDFDR